LSFGFRGYVGFREGWNWLSKTRPRFRVWGPGLGAKGLGFRKASERRVSGSERLQRVSKPLKV
jgi:hypothetical protein